MLPVGGDSRMIMVCEDTESILINSISYFIISMVIDKRQYISRR